MKGMQKISRGTGFRGALDYAFDREPGKDPGQLIGGNMSGTTADEIAAEFGVARRLRPDIEKPVWHNSLRLPKDEKLSNEQWCEIADDYMQRMGFSDDHQRCYILHDDADGQHIHIVASRVSLASKVYLGQNENLASTRHISALERDYGLTITKGVEYDEKQRLKMPGSKKPKKGEIEKAIRTGAEPPRQKLQRLIDVAKADKPTAPQFAERLEVAGVNVRANIAKTGTMSGFSYEIDQVQFKGSQLGDKYKWANLSKEVSYEQTRDREALARYSTSRDSNREDDEIRERSAAVAGATTASNLSSGSGEERASRSAGAANSAPSFSNFINLTRHDRRAHDDSRRSETSAAATNEAAAANTVRNGSKHDRTDRQNKQTDQYIARVWDADSENSEIAKNNEQQDKSRRAEANAGDLGRSDSAWNTGSSAYDSIISLSASAVANQHRRANEGPNMQNPELAAYMRKLPFDGVLEVLGYEYDSIEDVYITEHGTARFSALDSQWQIAKWPHQHAPRNAVDLIIGLKNIKADAAVEMLSKACGKRGEKAFEAVEARAEARRTHLATPEKNKYTWEASNDKKMTVKRYLTDIRKIDSFVVDRAHSRGCIWSDDGSNLCFGLGLHHNRGAEQRGTIGGESNKYSSVKVDKIREPFYLPPYKHSGEKIVAVVESGIEALSFQSAYPDVYVIGMGGSNYRNTIPVLEKFKSHGWYIISAMNNDKGGDHHEIALKNAGVIDAVMRPVCGVKDWNIQLQQRLEPEPLMTPKHIKQLAVDAEAAAKTKAENEFKQKIESIKLNTSMFDEFPRIKFAVQHAVYTHGASAEKAIVRDLSWQVKHTKIDEIKRVFHQNGSDAAMNLMCAAMDKWATEGSLDIDKKIESSIKNGNVILQNDFNGQPSHPTHGGPKFEPAGPSWGEMTF